MKRTILLLILSLSLVGCIGPPLTSVVELPNEPPIINFGALHSPNGVEQHAPYERDIYGTGYDPGGEIVAWIIRVNGETFRVGNDADRLERSEVVRYQFPGPGWYTLSITAFDDDGASTIYTVPPDGLWHIEH